MEAFNFLLIAVRPDYENKGLSQLCLRDQIPYINDYKIQRMETTSMLETNRNILGFFEPTYQRIARGGAGDVWGRQRTFG